MSVAEQIVGNMLSKALEMSNIAPKALAQEINYSVDAIYAATAGKRRIPTDAHRNVAQLHPIGGLAIAYQETGYELFLPIEGDMHPQNVIQRAMKEDHEADRAMEGLGWRLIDKLRPEDLSGDDRLAITSAAKEIIESIRAEITMLIAWENQYKIELVKLLTETIEKEKAAIKAAR